MSKNTLVAKVQTINDAHLIAAAPLMYDELVKVEKLLDDIIELEGYPAYEELQSIRAAIAKAKGDYA